MKLKTTLLMAAALLLESAVFSQTNPLIRYVPDDATMVFNIDIKRLASKIPPEVFRQSFFYREMMKDPDMPFSSFFSQPEKTGIDLSAGIMLAIKEGSGERRQPTIHIFIKLLNADLFTATIKEMMKKDEDQKIAVYGTDRIVESGGRMTAGWNNDVFVMTSGGYTEELMSEIYGQYGVGDTLTTMTDVAIDSVAWADTTVQEPVIIITDTTVAPPYDFSKLMEKFKKSQRELCFQLLTPKNNSSLLSNTWFKDIMNETADIKLWNGGNSNPLTENMFPFAELVNKLQPFIPKNKIALINFENGKIVLNARSFPENGIAGIYKKYPVAEQNTDLIRRLPEGTLLGLLNISFNQDMSNELMQKMGLQDMLSSFKKKIPFDLSLLPGTFKSTMMIAVLKSNMTTTTDATTSKMGGFQVIAAFPIADKAKFEKLKASVMPAWDSLKTLKETMFKEATPYAKYNDDLLVISLSPETASAFLNNPGTGAVPEWLQAYSKHPMLLNISLHDIFNASFNDRPERTMPAAQRRLLEVFGRMIIYGGEYENESINTRMEFTFANQEENALKQLFDMITSSMESKEEVIMSDEQGAVKDKKVVIQEVTLQDIKQEEKRIEPPPPPPPKTNPPKVEMKKYTPPVIKKK